MAHQVRVKLSAAVVSHKDLEIEVATSEGKLGTLLISKGNIEWLPTGNHVNKHKLTWKQFSNLMETQGKPAKVKK